MTGSFVFTAFGKAVAEFARSGELPMRPDLADLLLRRELIELDIRLIDDENNRQLRARQRLLEGARQTDDLVLQRQAREQLRRRQAQP